VIHNAKYNMHIASNPDISNRVNVADDILAVLNKFNDSSFIKGSDAFSITMHGGVCTVVPNILHNCICQSKRTFKPCYSLLVCIVSTQGRNKTNPDNIIGPKVIHNAKYNMHIASNPEISNRVNVADDILAVLNKFNDSSFIKEVITTNPKKPPGEFELFRLMTLVFLKQSTVT
jgi:hypothetical protein